MREPTRWSSPIKWHYHYSETRRKTFCRGLKIGRELQSEAFSVGACGPRGIGRKNGEDDKVVRNGKSAGDVGFICNLNFKSPLWKMGTSNYLGFEDDQNFRIHFNQFIENQSSLNFYNTNLYTKCSLDGKHHIFYAVLNLDPTTSQIDVNSNRRELPQNRDYTKTTKTSTRRFQEEGHQLSEFSPTRFRYIAERNRLNQNVQRNVEHQILVEGSFIDDTLNLSDVVEANQ